jgi:hypothetical protein
VGVGNGGVSGDDSFRAEARAGGVGFRVLRTGSCRMGDSNSRFDANRQQQEVGGRLRCGRDQTGWGQVLGVSLGHAELC